MNVFPFPIYHQHLKWDGTQMGLCLTHLEYSRMLSHVLKMFHQCQLRCYLSSVGPSLPCCLRSSYSTVYYPNFLPIIWVSLFVFLILSLLSIPSSQERKAILFLPIAATFPQKGVLQSSLLCQHWLHSAPGNYFKHHLSNSPLWGVESGHSALWTREAICFLPYLKL